MDKRESLNKLAGWFSDFQQKLEDAKEAGQIMGDLAQRSADLQRRYPDYKFPTRIDKVTAPGFTKALDQANTGKIEGLRKMRGIVLDAADEMEARAGGLPAELLNSGLSYAGFGGGGALGGGVLGALIGGPKRRMSGALIGAGVGGIGGLLANYLRRKNYYGDLIRF